ncbi:hypothetical protein EV126DRAFT_357012 [Verticillium dahliae]|nr:hypothetical protein EV126DRAFT_357012 [Verticillium dahliae]
MFGILGSVDIGSGQTFPTFDDLFKDLMATMQKDGYKVVKSRTHRNKVAGNYEKGSEVVRCDLVCDRGGQPYKCTATQLKTTTKKTNCPWRAKAVNRKTLGAWVLTVICDQHNHEPRTPEPPSDEEEADADGDAEIVNPDEEPEAPTLDPDTQAALAVAGVSSSAMRLTGETFHQFKGEYRRMSKPERIGNLAQMQMRIAAIYAVENEDLQRQERQARQEKKHQEIEEGNRRRVAEQSQQQQHQQQQQQHQVQQHQQQQQQQQHQQAQQQAHQQQQAQQQAQQQQVQQQHAQQQQHQVQQQVQQQVHHHQQQQHHHQQHQQHPMAQYAPMGGAPKHPFQQTQEEEQAQAAERRRQINQMNREQHMATPVQQSPMQQTPVQQTPVPVPQFGMHSAPIAQNIFRHYAGTPQQTSAVITPVTVPTKRRGRPPKGGSKGNPNGAS